MSSEQMDRKITKAVPSRRERIRREDIRIIKEMVRDIARLGSATKAVREEPNG